MSKAMESYKAAIEQMQQAGISPRFDGKFDYTMLRRASEFGAKNMPIEDGVTITPQYFGDMYAELIVPDNEIGDGVLVYIHGGGMVCGDAISSRPFGALMAKESGLRTYTFSYRLAPEDPYPAAVNDCYEAYKAITEEYPDKPIILVGESGGAYLTVVLTLKARDEGIRQPAGAIPYSAPMSISDCIDRARPDANDLILSPEGMALLGELYCPDEERRNEPYCSPCNADFTGVCPMLVLWDGKETLAPDSEILVEKLRNCGVEVEYKAYDDCFHAFPTTGKGTPEGADAIERTVAFISKRIGR